MRATRSANRRTGQPGGSYHASERGGYSRGAGAYGRPSRGAYADPPSGAQPKRGAGSSPLFRIGTALLLLAVAAVVVIGVLKNAEQNNLYSNRFTPGVSIDGNDVSGMEFEAVRSQFKEQYREKIADISIKITFGEKSWTLTGADLGAAEDVDDVVDQASKLGRTGSKEQRAAEAREVKASGKPFNITLSLDPEALKIKLSQIANEVSVTGRDASVSFNPDAMSFVDPEEPTDEELDQLEKMFTVNDEIAGQTVDVDTMAQKITDDLKDDYRAEQELVVKQFVPSVTAESLRKSFRFVATFRTHISSASTEERVDNIRQALKQFNGKVLYPGEELSFNDTTGPRTEANGYKMAHVINKNAYVDDWGGGVCQASTTLYNAILLAGCEITDRGHHSIPSDYVPLGFDAMVNYPNGDLKFKNASSGPVYIKAWVSPKKNAYVMVFGEPLSENIAVQGSYKGCAQIDRFSDTIFQGPNPGWDVTEDKDGQYAGQYTTTVTLEDGTKVTGCVTMNQHPDLTVDAYLIYKDANGREIGRKQMYEDTFKAVKGTVYVPVASPTPKPGATAGPTEGSGEEE